MEVSDVDTFVEMWDGVEACVRQITGHMRSNLKARLNAIHCDEKSDIIAHLNEMDSITNNSQVGT